LVLFLPFHPVVVCCHLNDLGPIVHKAKCTVVAHTRKLPCTHYANINVGVPPKFIGC